MKLKKGDRVKVLSGKDKGAEGAIIRVLPKDNKVVVEGVNVVKKHQKATQKIKNAGIIERAMPLNASNVAIIGPNGKPTRLGHRIDADGKSRIAKSDGGNI